MALLGRMRAAAVVARPPVGLEQQTIVTEKPSMVVESDASTYAWGVTEYTQGGWGMVSQGEPVAH
jgi:hypothetical protein